MVGRGGGCEWFAMHTFRGVFLIVENEQQGGGGGGGVLMAHGSSVIKMGGEEGWGGWGGVGEGSWLLHGVL